MLGPRHCSGMDNTCPNDIAFGPMESVVAIMEAAATIETRAEEILGTVGLSLARQKALHRLVLGSEPLSLSEMAQQLTCVRSNMTQLIDRLEADGLVRRVDDPSDRRIVRAEITPAGRELEGKGDQLLETARQELMGAISPEDNAHLVRILAVLR